ncbi:MAG: hypothetical protein DWQ07_21675 [Chloroflexi bacterium]|nr:MAG: hypothetical protein DWQ07_21675 [Chloroflexota bacterium]
MTYEAGLHLVAIGLALFLRLLNLGDIPLAESEALWALQAHEVAEGTASTIGPQPAYIILTSFLFSIFTSSEFLARLLPALAGTALVALPFLYRESVGRKAALVLAFGLAIGPGLVAVSRQAGGPMLAVALLLASMVAWQRGAAVWLGVLGTMALLAGPQALTGLVILLLVFVPAGLLGWREKNVRPANMDWPRVGLTALGTLMLVGTYFLRFPQGLSALGAVLPDYLVSWFEFPETPTVYMGIALLVYQALPLAFGIVGAIYAFRENYNQGRVLALASLVAFIVLLVYPFKQVTDLVWVVLPLWVLAAQGIARFLDFSGEQEDWLAAGGLTGLIFLLLSFAWLTLAGLGRTLTLAPESAEFYGRWVVTGVVVLVVITATVLIAYGWSLRTALHGLAWGSIITLLTYSLAALWGTTQLRDQLANELWHPSPVGGQADLMMQTLGDLSEWYQGQETSVEIAYLTESPSVRWALRYLPEARFAETLGVNELPPLIITEGFTTGVEQTASYRGQSFAWRISPDWGLTQLPPDFISWLLFRDAPTQAEEIILWARADLFPAADQLISEPEPVPLILDEEDAQE